MGAALKFSETLELLKNATKIESQQFAILQSIANEFNQEPESPKVKELILRVLENKKYFTATQEILNDLVRNVGLFPYLDQDLLSLKDSIAYNYHKPEKLKGIVFHQEQYPIYQKILNGKNVVLSAPTSFGKSKIIDAFIAKGVFKNIVVVVPTLALIDETRRRLTDLFSDTYEIVAHPTQKPDEKKNIFIFTPERVIVYKDKFPSIDFFVIDEFYKIGGQSESDKRVVALNEAFYYLYKKQKAQFYMLGPNIQTISDGAGKRFDFEFVSTDYNTVINEVIPVYIDRTNNRLSKLYELCSGISEPTLIYCKSIPQVYEVTEKLCELESDWDNIFCSNMSEWLSNEFHPDWALAKSVKKGIGIHYGPLPRSIAQDTVRQFNDGNLRFLVCTSTLIEGVNTRAKNVIIYENKIARQKLDFFTFNNIKGRSGRMFEHFIGRVFRFDEEPQMKLPFIDFPLHEQGANTPESLLIQLDSEDLTPESKERVDNRITNSPLPIELLKENHGIEPKTQVQVYKYIYDNINSIHGKLSWNQFPKYKQLEECCKIIWENWIKKAKNGVYSYKQLCIKIWQLRDKKSLHSRISDELKGQYAAKSANEAVERVFGFDRNWAGFDFPQLLMALDRIQRFVFKENNLPSGDYAFFAKRVESLFLPDVCTALDEFGIPINLSQKYTVLMQAKTLTEALSALKRIKLDVTESYENNLILNAQEGVK